MFCPNCGKEVNQQDAFCTYCGRSLKEMPIQEEELRCPHCGFKPEQEDIYCLSCGHRLRDEQAFPIAPVAKLAPQPRANTEKKPFNVMALIGFILALVGMSNFLGDGTYAVTAIPALVLGILGLKESKKLGVGKAFAITAIVVASVALGLSVLSGYFEFTYEPIGSFADSSSVNASSTLLLVMPV